MSLSDRRAQRSRPPSLLPRLRRRSPVRATDLFYFPVVIVFVVLFALPLAQSAYWSVTDYSFTNREPAFVGLENYARVATDSSMTAALGFTLLYAIGTTVLVTVLAIPLALVLNRRFFGKNLVRSVFFFPAIPSIAVLGLVWGFILSPLGSGVVNSVLDSVAGLGPIPFLSDPLLAQLSVIGVGVWSQLGWHAILYLAYLQAIPAELYEVARIDGASPRQQFWSITLPLLTPAISVSQLLLLTSGLKVYDLPYALTAGGPGFSTFTITQSLIQRGISQAQFGEASALAVVFMLIVGAIVLTQLVIARRIDGRYS
jgi:multiple sugar transport system permease protein/raffinose/stachyose/melibiose transport system permease protein